MIALETLIGGRIGLTNRIDFKIRFKSVNYFLKETNRHKKFNIKTLTDIVEIDFGVIGLRH